MLLLVFSTLFLLFNDLLIFNINYSLVLFMFYTMLCISLIINIYFGNNKDVVINFNPNFFLSKTLLSLKCLFLQIFFFFSKFFYYGFITKGLLRWKPLFKKTSYYGLYRSNRNQWLNK